MAHKPTLTLVQNCGKHWKRPTKSPSRRVRMRRLRVKPFVNPQLSAGDDLELVSAPLGNDVSPLGDGALRDFKSLGEGLSGSEVLDSGRFLHSARRYSILNTTVKDGKPPSRLSCLDMETMGVRIKRLRNAKGLTQQEVADFVGVSKGAVSQWEGGAVANLKLTNILRLCDLLGTDIAYLVYGPTRKPATGIRLDLSG